MAKQKKGAVLITGASSGIGKACALLLDRSGYRVFAGVRKQQAGEQLKAESSERLLPVILDVTDQEQIAAAVETAVEALEPDQGLYGLVNNAGIVVGGPLEFLPIDDLRLQLEVNFTGQVAVTQAFLSLIRKGRGRIINIGSVSGRFALPFSGAYAASKFALEGMTDALRRELRLWGIPVVLLEPGTVETPIWEKSFNQLYERTARLPVQSQELYQEAGASMDKVMRRGLRRAIRPEDVAQVVHKALEARRPKIRYPLGKDARMAALSIYLPDRLKDWVIWKILTNKLPTAAMGW